MSFSNGRGAGGGGARRGGRNNSRGGGSTTGALRNSAGHGAARGLPYDRPTASTSNSASDGRWQHDLFGEKSDLYSPSINFSTLRQRVPGMDAPSASLRPFGSYTPAAQPLIVTATGQVTTYDPNATATAASAGQAIGIKGTNAAAAQRQAEILRKQQQKERAELLKQRKELEKQRQEKVKIAKEEDLGFVVEVAGLVAGTSAEDVQTAFGAYGEIRFCFIVDPNASDLIARLTFTRHDDAAAACSKLDGAIADGRPLHVKQATRTPMPPALPPLPKALASPNSNVPTLDLTGGSPDPTSRRQAAAAAPAARVAAPPSKMYADQIEAAQAQVFMAAPAATSMDIDMANGTSSIPTGPAAASAARQARTNGGRTGAPVSFLPGAPPVAPLAARLGPSLVGGRGGAGGNVGGNGVPAHAPRQPSALRANGAQNGRNGVAPSPSLLHRVGVTAAPGRGQNGVSATGERNGAGGGGGGGGQRGKGAAPALLARIA
ncbi:hypothetical protein JCM10908_003925 [Rhodotorula pacifica]|uniref:uncharacterized protein n=1 Tax=Rhodotorula pacifica TaxID=1495444 RepID=UPI00316E648F